MAISDGSILGQEQGCLQLGLPALGSFLFSSQAMADLQGCQISNLDLLTAIRHLSTIIDGHTRRLVDYRNLRSEELGGIYESLLELHPELNIEAGTFELRSAGGSERKTTGSYYTPDSLVQCLLDSALEPVMDQVLKNSDDAENALLQLKVCDPGCGSGHFLIAAAHRMAKRLASIRTGTQEPAPQATRTALRDVIGSCIYGVDINEMAVELCKVSLWMEALEPGKPLSFLDHRIKTGNSLLGATPALLQDGIPDDAFKPIEGDDKKYCQTYRKQNKQERGGQMSFLYDDAFSPWQWQNQLASAMLQIAETADDNFYSVKSQEQTYQRLLDSRDYDQSKLWADAWCAAFVWHKTSAFPYPITQEVFRKIGQNPGATTDWMHREIRSLANEYQFFHWHLAFPEVFHMPAEGEIAENEQLGWNGGFDVVLGNPPWERVKLQEKEFFASRDPEIASAPNKAARELLISDLETENPELWAEFKQASRQSAGIRHLLRDSNIYPLCGRGDVNLYTVFAEANRFHLNPTGLTGCVLPTGIATDDTTKFFFQDLMDKQALRSFYDFENRKGFFPDVDSRMKFCCFTAGSGITPVAQATVFAFFLHETAELSDPNKLFTLSHRDIELLNPNTRTCPIFRSRTDAELTRHIYRRVPALINENDPENGDPWGIKFSRMFDMSNDSHLFYTRQQLEDEGWQLQGNVFNKYGETYLPLYEGRMIHYFDHRACSVIEARQGVMRTAASDNTTLDEHRNPDYAITPRYWMEDEMVKAGSPDVYEASCYVAFKDVTSTTNARTFISTIIPKVASGHKTPLILPGSTAKEATDFIGVASSFVCDFICRQKLGGVSLTFFVLKQIPFIPPEILRDWDTTRLGEYVLELTYTAWDLEPFAKDCGYDGPPFRWDEERRFLLRCELDAAFFHLYLGTLEEWKSEGTPELLESFTTPHGAIDYIMETFPIVKGKDEEAHGSYRTKETILQIYDEMVEAIRTGKPYQTRLDPPPGPPTRPDGTFMSYQEFARDQPPHIHLPRDGHATTDSLQLSDLADTFPNRPFTVGLGVSTEAGQLRVVPKTGQQLQARDSVLIAHPQLERRGTSTPVAWGELRFSDYRDATSGELYRSVSIRGEDGVAQLRISEQEWNQLTTVGSVEEVN